MTKRKVYLIITSYSNEDEELESVVSVFQNESERDKAYNKQVEELEEWIKDRWSDESIDLRREDTYDDCFCYNNETNYVYYSSYNEHDVSYIRREDRAFEDADSDEIVAWDFRNKRGY